MMKRKKIYVSGNHVVIGDMGEYQLSDDINTWFVENGYNYTIKYEKEDGYLVRFVFEADDNVIVHMRLNEMLV